MKIVRCWREMKGIFFQFLLHNNFDLFVTIT